MDKQINSDVVRTIAEAPEIVKTAMILRYTLGATDDEIRDELNVGEYTLNLINEYCKGLEPFFKTIGDDHDCF